MNMRRWRQGFALLLASLLILCFPASAGERDLPVWLWFMPFDGTPNAVRARFNELAQTRADQGQFDAWTEPPTAQSAMSSGNAGFIFFDGDEAAPITAGPVSYRISGGMDAGGAVADLRIDIAPASAFSRDYLSGCDQLAQICAESVFDALSERTERNLLLALLYDLRPFSYHDKEPLDQRARALRTVIDGRLATMEWAVGPDNAMWFTIALGAEATEQEIEAARLNNRCNRLLSQSSDECGALRSCLQQMADQLGSGEPDWPDLAADASQASESAALIEELQRELQGYEKAKPYADQMGAHLPELQSALALVQAALDQGNAEVLGLALDEAVEKAKAAQKVIGVIRTR